MFQFPWQDTKQALRPPLPVRRGFARPQRVERDAFRPGGHVSRLKLNAVAWKDAPERKPGQRGRPRKKGNRVKLWELFETKRTEFQKEILPERVGRVCRPLRR